MDLHQGQKVRITGGVSAHGKTGEVWDLGTDHLFVGVRIPSIKRAKETTYVTRESLEPLES